MKNAKLAMFAFAALSAFSAAPRHAHAAWFDCDVSEIGEVVGSRLHVKCNNSIVLNGQTIRYIAISSTSSAAPRFAALGNAAVMSGRTFRANVPTTSAGAPANTSGCSATDCRTPDQFFLLK